MRSVLGSQARRRRSFSDIDEPQPASRERPGCDPAAREATLARTFRIQPHRASLALRVLRATVLLAAQAALCYGEAGPEAVLAELWRAASDLAAWWREAGGDRGKAMAKGRIE